MNKVEVEEMLHTDVLSEEDVPKLYFSITEAAALLKVSTFELRKWVKAFNIDLHQNKRTRKYRISKVDFELLQRIHFLLKVELYSLKGAIRKLEQGENG